MYKHLVVAVDGSHTSENALAHAVGLAKVENAQLTLVNVANPAEYMALAPEFLQHESYEAAALAEGTTVLDAAEHRAQAVLGEGKIQRHLLMGSFAETVMRETRLPLLVIRSERSEEEA